MSSKYDDAAVSRLVEAARAVVDRWDTPSWKDVPATAGYINDLRNALPPASPAPGPRLIKSMEGVVSKLESAKGVRCWRHMCYKGNPDPNSYDRIRRYGDGEYELVYRDGRTKKVHGTDYANSSAYVECPDSPYVAPPVAAPSSAGTEPAAMETAEAFVIRLNYTQGPADKARMIESRDAAWQARLDAANAQLAGDKAELLAALSNRDAEIARLTKQRDDAEREINESARARTGEESRLSAAGGVDRELLETARALMPSLIAANPQASIRELAEDCVDYARALHAALTAKSGEVGNG